MEDESKKQNNKIEDIIDNTFSRLKEMVNGNITLGDTQQIGKSYIIPVSRISLGFVSGGGNMPKSKAKNMVAGTTTGFKVEPIGFVTLKDDDSIGYIPVNNDLKNNTVDAIFKIFNLVKNQMQNKEESKEDDKEV